MNSDIEQSAISLPRPITIRWSAVDSISDIRWLETKTVRPSAARAFIRFLIHKMPSGSSPLTGSSNMSTLGSPSKVAAMPKALAHAEREPLGPLLRHLGEADKLEDLADAALRQVVGLRQAEQVVVGRPAAVHRLRVEQRADLAHRISQVAVVAAVHRDGASVRVVKPEDAPHRGGLAGPVRAQEAGDLARLNAERQPVDGGFLPVPLREALHLNH